LRFAAISMVIPPLMHRSCTLVLIDRIYSFAILVVILNALSWGIVAEKGKVTAHEGKIYGLMRFFRCQSAA
jgi:hypothetical protein